MQGYEKSSIYECKIDVWLYLYIYIVEFLHILLQTTELPTKANNTITTTTTAVLMYIFNVCVCVV